jgi:hypothetical protein
LLSYPLDHVEDGIDPTVGSGLKRGVGSLQGGERPFLGKKRAGIRERHIARPRTGGARSFEMLGGQNLVAELEPVAAQEKVQVGG